MGWWQERGKLEPLTIGDEPLDAIGEMFKAVLKSYREEVGRPPRLEELEKCLGIALSSRFSELSDVSEGVELASVSLKLKRPKRQRITRGDYFGVPLPSGGYGFGRVTGIFATSILHLDFLRVYSETLLAVEDLQRQRVLFTALCGYLGLADGYWKMLGSIPLPEERTNDSEEVQLRRLMDRYHEALAPVGDAPGRLEEALRRSGCIPRGR